MTHTPEQLSHYKALNIDAAEYAEYKRKADAFDKLIVAFVECKDSLADGVSIIHGAIIAYEKLHSSSKAKHPDDGWIPWSGGECPIIENLIVDYKLTDGYEKMHVLAGLLDWKHLGSQSDIIAYKLSGSKS